MKYDTDYTVHASGPIYHERETGSYTQKEPAAREKPEPPVDGMLITIAQSINDENSVLYKNNNTVNYSLNPINAEPYIHLTQLYLQQVRENNNFKSPYFITSKQVRDLNLEIRKNQDAFVHLHWDKDRKEEAYEYLYNIEQLKPGKNFNPQNEYLFDKNPALQPIPVHPTDAKAFFDDIEQTFTSDLSRYASSIFEGKEYKKIFYTSLEKDALKYLLLDTAHPMLKNIISCFDTISTATNNTVSNANSKPKIHRGR
jgi:hypothetical protein